MQRLPSLLCTLCAFLPAVSVGVSSLRKTKGTLKNTSFVADINTPCCTSLGNKKTAMPQNMRVFVLCWTALKHLVAEREGFEPSIRCRIHTFQACAFDHSAISPDCYC